jgi:hypothetical protein
MMVDDSLFRIAWGNPAVRLNSHGLNVGFADPGDPSDLDFTPTGPGAPFVLWAELPDGQIVYSDPALNQGYSIPGFDAFRWYGEGRIGVRKDYVHGDITVLSTDGLTAVPNPATTTLLLAGALMYAFTRRRKI